MSDIFAALKAAAAQPSKNKKISEVPVLDDPIAVDAAKEFTRASYLMDILSDVKDNAAQTLKDRASTAMINHGAKTLSKPTSLRILTEFGQVSANLTTRGSNRPLDEDTIHTFTKYGISTTKHVSSPGAYVFNNDVLKVSSVAERISTILDQDPEIQQLLAGAGITSPVVCFQPEQASTIVADASFGDLFKSAVGGAIASEPNLTGDQRIALVKQLFDVIAVLKTESSVKPKNVDTLSVGKELLSLILDDGNEKEEGTPL